MNDYTKFEQGNKVKYYEAYLEVLNPHLDIIIPQSRVAERGWRYEGEVTLRDFSLKIVPSVNNNKSIVLLSAPDDMGKTLRSSATSEADLEIWVNEILPFGYGYDDLLTREEAEQLMEEL